MTKTVRSSNGFFRESVQVEADKTGSAEDPFRVAMQNETADMRRRSSSKQRRFFHVTEARLNQSGMLLLSRNAAAGSYSDPILGYCPQDNVLTPVSVDEAGVFIVNLCIRKDVTLCYMKKYRQI